MDLLTILIIAFGVSMDAFAVSISTGCSVSEKRLFNGLKAALFFGGFQALMPLIGWKGGSLVRDAFQAWDHWIILILLCGVGLKMIFESKEVGETCKEPDLKTLFILAIATSIDALAVGVSFAFAGVDIVSSVIIIGSITFVVSLAGFMFGSLLGHLFEKKIEIIGGIILIAIGIRVVVEHMSNGI